MSHGAPETLIAQLERHEQRRAAGVPTVSVLVGPVDRALNAWQGWSAARGLGQALIVNADAAQLVRAWALVLAEQCSLPDEAAVYLARRLGTAADDLQRQLALLSSYERDLLLEQRLAGDDGPATACRWLLLTDGLNSSTWVDELDAVLARRDVSPFRVIRALSGLLPQPTLPSVVIAGSTHGNLAVVGRLLAELASAVPTVPAVLILSAEQWDTYLRESPASRAQALLREGLVNIEATAPRATADLTASVQRLQQENVPPELVESLAEAAAARPDRADDEAGHERARSAAESFLFKLLETLPATAGLFELNASLDFRFGPRAAEVDLVSRDLALAIEIDGYYHFQGLDAYRRDRRKDLALQRAGYLVLRFLADDVVVRLEETLDAILAAVAFRRQPLSKP